MIFASADEFNAILTRLSILRYVFVSRTKGSEYDLNKQSEKFFARLLNLVLDKNLKVMEKERKNFPAIDLGDDEARLCIQVTAENRSKKIRKTLEKFEKHSLSTRFDRLLVLVITNKKKYTATFDDVPGLDFSVERDVWDIDDLLLEIDNLELSRLKEVGAFLEQELPSLLAPFMPSNTKLRLAEDRIHQPPTHAGAFRKAWGDEEDEAAWQADFKDIMRFYKKLTGLPPLTRQYLYLFMTRGTVDKGEDRIGMSPGKIRGLLENGKDSDAQLEILDGERFVDYPESGVYPKRTHISFRLDSGTELFALLKDFCKASTKSPTDREAMLERLIVDCRFDLFDDPSA